MLHSTIELLYSVHALFDEIDYHPRSDNLSGDAFYDKFIYTLNHTKSFDDAIALVRMFEFYLKREDKFLKKLSKYSKFWDEIEYEGREEIAVVSDEEAIGTYHLTNLLNQNYKQVYFSSQTFENELYELDYAGGLFSLGDESEYFLRYSKMSSVKMVLTNKNKKAIATIVLSKSLGIFLENNNTRYELETYDAGIAFFEKNYIYSLGKNEEPDLDKECKGFIQWDTISEKSDFGLSRLEVYDNDADLDLMLLLAASIFLVFRSYHSGQVSHSIIMNAALLNAVRFRRH